MILKSIVLPAAAACLVLGMGVSGTAAATDCFAEGFINYSTHGTTGPESVFYVSANTGVNGVPSNVTWKVTTGWGTGQSGCDDPTPANNPLGPSGAAWGLIVQGNHQRVRVKGIVAGSCPASGNVRDFGCFAGATVY
jgi:hypothetical protein